MHTINNTIVIDEADTLQPNHDGVFFTDVTGIRCYISNKTIIRLYSLLKCDLENNGINFDEYCNNLFK